MDNALVRAEEAHISVQDRGFRLGDGVFETIAVYQGVPYQWDLHMERLKKGLWALRIEADISNLYGLCQLLLQKNGVTEGGVRLTISRGAGSSGYLPAADITPTIVMEALPPAVDLPEEADVWISALKKPAVAALPVHYKLTHGINSTLARLEAQDHDCFEALLLNEKEEVCEASSSNIFWVKGKRLFTPAIACGVLEGTTRAALLRITPLEVEEGVFSLDALRQADEAFLTNSFWQILPIKQIIPENILYNTSKQAQLHHRLLREDIAAHVAQHEARVG